MDGMINRKNIKIVLVIFTILIIAVIGIFYWDESKLSYVDISAYAPNDNISYAVDSCIMEETISSVAGWAAWLGEDVGIVNTEVALKSKSTGTMISIPTQMQQRADVTAAVNDGFHYDNSGFTAYVETKKLDVYDSYEVFILMKNGHGSFYAATGVILEAGSER